MSASATATADNPFTLPTPLIVGLLLAVAVGSLWSLVDRGDGFGDMFEGTEPAEEVPAGSMFVRCDTGDNGNDGLSHANAKLTIAAATAALTTTGQDIYLLEGEECNEQVNMQEGTSSNWSVIGAYYFDADTAYVGLTDPGDLDNEDPGSRPIIRGTWNPTCVAAQNCPLPNAGAIPSSISQALVDCNAEDYCQIQDLYLTETGGRFITADAGAPSTDISTGFRMYRNYMYYGAWNVVIEDGWREIHIDGNTMHKYNVCESEDAGWYTEDEQCASGGWPGGILLGDLPRAYALVENNRVYNGEGEAYNCLTSQYCYFRNNVSAGHHSGSIYADTGDYVVREGNILFGNPAAEAAANNRRAADFGGTVTGAEDGQIQRSWAPDNTDRNLIRNNIIVGRGVGFYLSVESTVEDEYTTTADVFGNTYYGIDVEAFDVNNKAGNGANIENNIFVSRSLTDNCRYEGANSTPASIANNYWDRTPDDTACIGTADVVGGSLNYPITPEQADDVGHVAIMGKSYGELITDYGTPGSGSAVEGASKDRTSTTLAYMAAANWDWIPAYLGSEWREEALSHDIRGNARKAGGGSIGALETTP